MPQRVQLSRRKGWRMPPNTVKVDRSTKWENPFNFRDSAHCWTALSYGEKGNPAGRGEFAFRLNEGDVSRHTLERLASLFGAAIGRRLTYAELIA